VQPSIFQHTFPNGLILLAERMDHVRSATFNFLVPAGCSRDPVTKPGLAGVVAELISRGAGERDSRALMMALDRLGVDSSESVGIHHMRFWGSTLARNLAPALDIYADIILRPHFPEDELGPVRDLAVQDIKSLEDEHSARLMIELRKNIYPAPLSNDHRGTLEGVESITTEDVRAYHKRQFGPSGTIMAVTGSFEWPVLLEQIGRLFGGWKGEPSLPLEYGPEPGRDSHLTKELEQTQIAVAYKSVPVPHPDYYSALGAVNVLSGGMGARLFTEIREKEGLCYSVSASYQPMKDRGAVVAYAASLNHQAQRTLDKLFEELTKLRQGVTDEEVSRVRVGLKTSLIMQQESTSSRALSLASDWYNLGRVRSFDEIQAAIEGLTPASIKEHLERFPPGEFRVVTLGPSPLKTEN
jgi:predicted Zn-dependent peptidase